MAVPKKKTSKSRRNMRRSHLALTLPKVGIDKDTGSYKLSHHLSEDNFYAGKKIIEEPVVAEEAQG